MATQKFAASKSPRKSLIVGIYENAAIVHQTEGAQSTSSVMVSQKTNQSDKKSVKKPRQ